MVELKFDDYVISRYEDIGIFNEGLARVKNRDNLWGFIDKKGKEVIPCQYQEVTDFSDGLSAVLLKDKICYINKDGEIKNSIIHKHIDDFKEGMSVVRNSEGLWGYINTDIEEVIPCQYKKATEFREGYGIVEQSDGYSYINARGELFGKYTWISHFSDGLAIIREEKEIYSIDRNFQKKSHFSEKWREFGNPYCGLILWKNLNDKYGYLNEKLEPAIANMFDRARDFKEDVAIIEIKRIIGFVDKFGKITAFSKEMQYSEIRDFSEGLAAVKNPEGLWGFIDKSGNEVISCQYLEVNDFSEGLCAVLNTKGEFYYINKKGTIKISIDREYCSTLKLGDEEIVYIKTTSKKELLEKKLEVLNQVKEQKIKQVIDDITDTSSDIMGDIYDLSKKRKRTNK